MEKGLDLKMPGIISSGGIVKKVVSTDCLLEK